MQVVIEKVLILMIFAAVGYTLCKAKITKSSDASVLSKLAVYVFLPAMSFKTYATSFTVDYVRTNYSSLLLSVAVVAVLALISLPLSRLLTRDAYLRKVYHYSITIANYGYMGYVLAENLYGGEMLLSVMVYALPLAFYVYGVGYPTLTNSGVSAKKFFNPSIIASLLGMAVGLCGLTVPEVALDLLGKAAACVGPISMLLTGMTLSEYRLRTLLCDRNTYIVTALRLLVMPSLLAGTLILLDFREAVIPMLMLYAMPCGLNMVVFPKLVGERCEAGASLALVSSVLSCATIPLMIHLWV